MDKNIAAFLRENTKTIVVNFQVDTGKPKNYTYLTEDATIAAGDWVVVPYSPREGCERFSVAYVVKVHDDLCIEPNADEQHHWVVQKLDMKAYDALLKANAQLQSLLSAAYRERMKKSFAQSLLGDLSAEAHAKVALLLGGKTS